MNTGDSVPYTTQYLDEVQAIARQIDRTAVDRMVDVLVDIRR